MMNDPIKVMYDEHDVILKARDIIDAIQDYWLQNDEGYSEAVSELLDFFKNYADGYHHHKEEQVLFPAIKNHPDFTLQEIVDEFNEHHESFRDYASEIREAINEKEYVRSHKVLKQYIFELMDHIGAENDELFVLAQNLFSEKELENVYFLFMDVDRNLGLERKQEYEAMPDRILGKLKLDVS